MVMFQREETTTSLERLLCPIFLRQLGAPKTSNYCFKNGAQTAFQALANSPSSLDSETVPWNEKIWHFWVFIRLVYYGMKYYPSYMGVYNEPL